jgi:hypothetical protein
VQGHLWGWENSTTCAFKDADGTPKYYVGFEPADWVLARPCAAAPFLTNAIMVRAGRQGCQGACWDAATAVMCTAFPAMLLTPPPGLRCAACGLAAKCLLLHPCALRAADLQLSCVGMGGRQAVRLQG